MICPSSISKEEQNKSDTSYHDLTDQPTTFWFSNYDKSFSDVDPTITRGQLQTSLSELQNLLSYVYPISPLDEVPVLEAMDAMTPVNNMLRERTICKRKNNKINNKKLRKARDTKFGSNV